MVSWVEWALTNRQGLAAVLVAVVLIICVYIRERSWSNYTREKEVDIQRLETELDTALYRIQMEISGNPSCDFNASSSKTGFETPTAVIDAVVNENVALFDSFGSILILLATCAKTFEIELFHNHISRDETVFRLFISFWTPVTSLLVFTVCFLAGSIAWLGIVSRHQFAHGAIKFVICYVFATPVSQAITNMIRIRRYLPSTREKWLRQLSTLSCWGWLLSKIFNMDSLEKALINIVSVFFSFWLMWPYRYFFYHCHTCSANAAATDLFLTNMLLHCSFTLMWLASLQMQICGSPLWIRNPKSSVLRWIPLLWAGPKGGLPLLWLIALGLSLIVCVFRIVWFAWFGGCTWWGAAVAWVFCHLHIVMFVTNVALISVSVTRLAFIQVEEEKYVDTFVAEHKRRRGDTRNTGATSTSDSNNINNNNNNTSKSGKMEGEVQISAEEKADVRSLASGIFHALLDKAVRSYALGNGDISYYNMKDRAAKQEGEKKEQKSGRDAEYRDFKLAFEYAQYQFMTEVSLRFEDVAKELALEKKRQLRGNCEMTKSADDNDGGTDEELTEEDIARVTAREVFSNLLGADI